MVVRLKNKYFKPTSLAWWSCVTPLALGVFIATEPMHGMAGAVNSVQNATGLSAPMLINAGLAGIGFRGAL